MVSNLNQILDFVRLLNKFREVERVIHANGGDRFENDAEHSYQLSMLAWYIISTNNLNLNLDSKKYPDALHRVLCYLNKQWK